MFAARDATVEELAQQVPLVRFETLTLVRAGDLRAAGFRLEPTGRNRRHFIVAVDDDGQVHFAILPGPVAKNRHLLDRTVA